VTLVLLFLVAVGWAIYVAAWVRSRGERRGVNSISTFSKHLSVLERTSPARVGPGGDHVERRPSGRPEPIFPAASYVPARAAMSLSDARRRRRNVLYALAGAAVGTLVLIPFAGSTMLLLHVVTDVLLVGYIGLLIRTQRLAAERRVKVHYLPTMSTAATPEPQFLLQRSAN
jgi:hypothetical protein